ncbi:carbon-nitrogen hydrolase family protein [Kitasatospora sp. NBC_01250]|uniref:carbon-nitrogen hydrolase family protein n=1 Tax=unclassified Kitasatospora TaxID=2633591 RepID=UPI002E10E6A4|nr:MULTISPECIES: carbon-nitrogen hydrolase family protein [unclassified Kitasatospora]WSJ65956.1 carbon-nitrogen hydrolase family protein [Kitasatospora sp. NBC_01302]
MRIACWQAACGSPDVPHLLERLRTAARQAAEAGAELLVAPEMTVGGYPLRPGMLAEAREPAGGRHGAAVAGIAREHRIALLYGWPESDGDAVYNASRLVSAEGVPLAGYRKAHLFGEVDRSRFVPGDNGVVQARLGELTVGLLICYDVEFPEAVRAHALAGTQLLLVPTALMNPWHVVARTLVPARAFESQLYIAYANWIGERGGLDFCGLSTVAAPDGTRLTREEPTEGLLLAEIDPAVVAKARRDTPYLHDRRPELYQGLPDRLG